jgi:putative protein-disulfide isomerase
MDRPHLIYFADPMCSWCWGFAPVIAAITHAFADSLPIRLVLGGLRPGTTEPLDETRKASLREHWTHVHEASGQPFDLDFFTREHFIYDTDPACRAVAALRHAGMPIALAALHRLQEAFYARNQDVKDLAVQTEIAVALGQDADTFRAAVTSEAIRQETWRDYALSQNTGVTGFPTLIAGTGQDNQYAMVTKGFERGERILPALGRWLAAQERKSFLFEKKNQKTFATWSRRNTQLRAQVAKVFCFFFSKKKSLPLLLITPTGHRIASHPRIPRIIHAPQHRPQIVPGAKRR